MGDIVGPDAVEYLNGRLPGLREEHGVDLIVANAENCAVSGPSFKDGFGMTVELVERLFEGGVDVVTGGNHSWDGPEAEVVLGHPRVLRPHNMPSGTPGRGFLTLEVGDEPVSVLNLTDAVTPNALPVYPSWSSLGLPGTTVIDFHANSVPAKQAFAHAVDGEVAAVLGTNTHEATLHLHLLPRGTGLVTEVGMTGPLGGVGGIAPEQLLAWFKGEDFTALPDFELANGPMTLGAVLLRIEGGLTRTLERLS